MVPHQDVENILCANSVGRGRLAADQSTNLLVENLPPCCLLPKQVRRHGNDARDDLITCPIIPHHTGIRLGAAQQGIKKIGRPTALGRIGVLNNDPGNGATSAQYTEHHHTEPSSEKRRIHHRSLSLPVAQMPHFLE